MKMTFHVCSLLFVPILCCSSIAAQPQKHETSLSYLVLKDHLQFRPNNVIQHIWQYPSTTCSITRPSDASLKDKTFLQFGFVPYLCLILYDATLRYNALNSSYVDNQGSPDIAQKIINTYKTEDFCEKMKENSWSTTIQENKLWVSHFNASMKNESSCKRYCVSDIVNPLCAFALWLDVSVKNVDHAPKHTPLVKAQGSGVMHSDPVERHHPASAINNGEPPNAAMEELHPDGSGSQLHLHAPPVGEPKAAKSQEKHGVPILEQNHAPFIAVTGGKIGVAGDPKSEHDKLIIPNLHTKGAEVASNMVHKAEQPGSENIQGDGKIVNVKVPPHANLNLPQNEITSDGNSFDPLPKQQNLLADVGHTGPVEKLKNIDKEIAKQEQSTREMEQAGIATETEGTDKVIQEKELLRPVNQQLIGNHDGAGQTEMPEALKDTDTAEGEGSDTMHRKQEADGGQSLNQPPEDDPMNTSPVENPKKPTSEETTKPHVKDNAKSTVPGVQLKPDPKVISGDQTDKEQSPASPPQIEHSNAAEGDQAGGEAVGPISDEPDDHEKQKIMEEEVAVHSRGEDGELVDSHRALDQPQDTDSEFGEVQDVISEEPRFNGEGDDPAQRPNASPKLDYDGGSDEEEDQIRVNEVTGKGQNDAGAGMYVHDRFDAEDSHFFAYFMTMIILCIIGYLIFHNKQKILALALEGRVRKGSRRRPSTSGYRKLDSNLEEAVTSNCAGPSVTHVIY